MTTPLAVLGLRVRALRCATLIDGTGRPTLRQALVVLDARGRIEYAGPASHPAAPDISKLPPGQCLEVGGSTVLPGLIDSHVHLTFGVDDADQAIASDAAAIAHLVLQIQADDDAARAARAVAAAQAALAAGVTTVRDCGARGRAVHVIRDLIEAGILTGPRILSSGAPVTTSRGHCWRLGGVAESTAEAVAQARARIQDGADFVKIMATGGGMTAGTDRTRAQYPTATLAALVEASHRLGRRIAAHAHGTEGIERCVAAGVDTIEHCSWEGADGLRLDPVLAHVMAAAGIVAGDTIAGPTQGAARRGLTFDALPEATQRRFALFRELRSLSVRVMTSSDAMSPVTPFEGFPWSVVASSIYGGLTPEEAVHAATGLPAAVIGVADETGTLAAGKRGDLLVVEGDVSADARALAAMQLVLRDGVVLAAPQALLVPGRR